MQALSLIGSCPSALLCTLQVLLPEEMPTAAAESTLHSIQFTCMFLAAKVADQVHAMGAGTAGGRRLG
jgi:hypothetical protein